MSLLIKIALPVIVAIAAVWGYANYMQPLAPAPVPVAQVPVQQKPAPVVSDNSDTALDTDLGAIDTQLQGAAAGSAAVDAGLADTAGDTSF
jgi:hypothetical protein